MEPRKIKSDTDSTVSPSICHEVTGHSCSGSGARMVPPLAKGAVSSRRRVPVAASLGGTGAGAAPRVPSRGILSSFTSVL